MRCSGCAEVFERFLAQKFPSSKRFGLEGCDALIPALHAFTRAAAAHGCERIELGMAHRHAAQDSLCYSSTCHPSIAGSACIMKVPSKDSQVYERQYVFMLIRQATGAMKVFDAVCVLQGPSERVAQSVGQAAGSPVLRDGRKAE